MGLRLQSLLFLTILITTSLAARPASTFILRGDRNSNVTISVNVPSDASKNELFFHIFGPAGQSWLAWGFGTEMKDALMFVAYTSEDGKNVTVSPRIGRGNVEPEFTSATKVEVLDGTLVNDETYSINLKCTDCRSWSLASGDRGSVNVKSTAEPMIYAIGGERYILKSNDQRAKIQEHVAYGTFNIDLSSATGDAGVPEAATVQAGISEGQTSGQNNAATVIHALFMGACFVVLFPFGALLIRLPFRFAFWIHLFWQLTTLVGVLIGFALGIYSTVKNNSKPNFNSAHQGLGFAVTILVLGQPVLGFLHHRTHKQTKSPTVLGKIHKYLGAFVICLGIVNGALGLDFADNNGKLPAYFGFVIFVVFVVTLVSWLIRRKGLRSRAMNSAAANNFREGAGAAAPAAAASGPGPVYGGNRGDVPLQSYGVGNRNPNPHASQQSFAQADHAPPNYVNVMPKNEGQRMS